MMRLRKSRFFPVWLAAVAGVSLTAIATITIWHYELESRKKVFRNQVDGLAAAMQERLDANLEVLRTTSSFYPTFRPLKCHSENLGT